VTDTPDLTYGVRRPEWVRKETSEALADGSANNFWGEALPWARQAKAVVPSMFVSVILAQWAEETGYGGYDWSVAHNPGNVGSFDGQPLNAFPNLTVGVKAYEQCLTNGYYTNVLHATTWQAQCYALGNSPWASAHYEAAGPPPGEDLIKIVNNFNLTQYDGASPVPTPTPTPPPTPAPTQTQETNMFTTDPETGGTWSTNANGALFAEFGAPFVAGLNQHPEYHAGSAESGNLNPCVGIAACKDSTGQWGVVFFTCIFGQPAPDGSDYHTYRFARNGQPD
jgi:hypothetical protein